jgi:hypothetical protein
MSASARPHTHARFRGHTEKFSSTSSHQPSHFHEVRPALSRIAGVTNLVQWSAAGDIRRMRNSRGDCLFGHSLLDAQRDIERPITVTAGTNKLVGPQNRLASALRSASGCSGIPPGANSVGWAYRARCVAALTPNVADLHSAYGTRSGWPRIDTGHPSV